MSREDSLVVYVEHNGRYILLKQTDKLIDIKNKYAFQDDLLIYMVYAKEAVFG
jgi:hypothetical protein